MFGNVRVIGWSSMIAAALGLCSAAPALARMQEDEPPHMSSLTLNGVTAVSKSELLLSIVTDDSHCRSVLLAPFCLITKAGVIYQTERLDSIEVKRDELRIRVFYWRRGYRQARVTSDIQVTDHAADVTFNIVEGPPTLISAVDIVQLDSVLTTSAIQSARLPRPGTPIDLIALDSATSDLRDLLWEEGYSDAFVEDSVVVSDADRTARIEIEIDPGAVATVEAIHIRGNEQIEERTILNSLGIRPGEIYRRSDLVASQRNLYESSLFRQAVIDVPEGQDSSKVINVTVREAPLRAVHTAAGFNTVDFIQTEAGFTHYNWFGRARRLELTATVGNLLAPQLNGTGIFEDVTPPRLDAGQEDVFLEPTWQASAGVTQPWFRSPKNQIGLSVFAHRRSVPGIVIDRGFGASASFTRRLAYHNPLSVNYRFEFTTVEAGTVYYCVNFGVCDLVTIEALRNTQRLSPLALSLSGDVMNDPLSPTEGYTYLFTFEHASVATLSDFRYNRASAEGSRYIPIGAGRSVIAFHLRAGWVGALASTAGAVGLPAIDTARALLHPRKRFYAGGSRSVRGYGENQLGPRILTIDPTALMSEDLEDPCTMESIASGECDPSQLPSSEFQARPLGGNTVIEGSVEYRFPLAAKLRGAVFVDAASVGQSGINPFSGGFGAVTPGFGIRYDSPAGPVRIDLGLRPALTEQLPVITQTVDADGNPRIVRLALPKDYNPLEGASGIGQITRRLTLHLSIGQAF